VAEKAKQKRIRGTDYWAMQKAIMVVEEAKEAFQNWQKEEARKVGKYLDQVDFVTGAISKQVLVTAADGSQSIEMIVEEHISQDLIKQGQEEFAKIQAAVKKANLCLANTAKKYQVFMDCIDMKTGEINKDYEREDPPEADGDEKVAGCIAPAPDEEASPDATRKTEEATD